MGLSVASSALAAAAFVPGRCHVAAGYAPALCQDFQHNEPSGAGERLAPRRELRQLQAWWDAHAYYPRHASNSDEGGTVKVHLVILPLTAGSGRSIWWKARDRRSLDAAGSAVFRGGSCRPFS